MKQDGSMRPGRPRPMALRLAELRPVDPLMFEELREASLFQVPPFLKAVLWDQEQEDPRPEETDHPRTPAQADTPPSSDSPAESPAEADAPTPVESPAEARVEARMERSSPGGPHAGPRPDRSVDSAGSISSGDDPLATLGYGRGYGSARGLRASTGVYAAGARSPTGPMNPAIPPHRVSASIPASAAIRAGPPNWWYAS